MEYVVLKEGFQDLQVRQTIKEFHLVWVQLFQVFTHIVQYYQMASSGSTQSQPSYSPIILEKPPIEFLINSIRQSCEQSEAAKVMASLAQEMRTSEGSAFERCLEGLNYLFQKGFTSVFMTHVDLMRKMMNHFTKLGKLLQDDAHDESIEFRMLYVLSMIAELIRENPKFYFPFTRKFLVTVFRIDFQLLEKSPKRRDILAILSVIYENFSRQGRLVNKYNLLATLKSSLLENYALIEELFTLKVFNRAICNLASKGLVFSTIQFRKYKLLETLARFVDKQQAELLLVKMKLAMAGMKRQSEDSPMTSQTS